MSPNWMRSFAPRTREYERAVSAAALIPSRRVSMLDCNPAPIGNRRAGCHPAPQAIELIGALVKRSAPRGAGGAGFRSPAAEASARPARSGPRHPAARLAADRFRQRPGAGALPGALLAAGSVPARASRRAGLSTTAGERACPTVHGAVGEIG